MQYLNELNNNQYKAVTSNQNKILVLAGAGSGKTKTLTSRIRYLIDNKVSEDSIVAFTFTNKAALEMKTRLRQSLKREHEVSISTFHGYAMRYFPIYGPLFGYTKKVIVLTDEDRSRMLRRVLNELDLNNRSNMKYFKYISMIKNNTPITDLTTEESLLVNNIYHKYQEKQFHYNTIDFDDMIPLFLKFLKSGHEEAEYLKESIEYILVDECQDTNPIQFELINELASHNKRIFMVGDDDQLIYSFRNSDKKLMENFQDTADEVIVLNENYRCSKNILEVANNLIDNNTKRNKKELFSSIDVKAKVRYKEYDDVYKEAKEVTEHINVLIKKGYEPKDIAVLYRNNNQAYLIEKELSSLKIPYETFSGKNLLENLEIILIVSIYRFLLNQHDLFSLEKIAINSICGMEVYIYSNFIQKYDKTRPIIPQMMNFPIKKINELGNKLNGLLNLYNDLDNEKFFDKILKEFNYSEYLKTTSDRKTKYERIISLKGYIKDTPANELLNLFNELTLETVKDNKNKVSLLTIHKSKGLEFKCVFIIGCNEGIIPPIDIKKDAKDEERRCLYVAITRAREVLYITSSTIHYINGVKKKYQVSSFLKETGLIGKPIKTKYYENN